MKKIIIFLIAVLLIIPSNIKAKSSTFYEGEYIDAWQIKIVADRTKKYYQRARFFRENGTNLPAYCIEPFKMFTDNNSYESTFNPESLTEEQKTRIQQLAYLGYQNGNKKENEWYAVTQLLIWQTAEPNGIYYFTDSLNGNKTDKYQPLIDELNEDVIKFNQNSEFKSEYTISTNDKIEIIPNYSYNVTYNSKNSYTTIENNKITIENLPVGTHEIKIIKESISDMQPSIFYQSPNSQNLITIGKMQPQEINLKVNVIETELKVTKMDEDNNSIKPSGQAKLEGTTYQLYDQHMNKLQELKIDNTSSVMAKNIPFGTYYLREIIAGEGYILDENTHKIEITYDSPKVEINLKNKVINGKLEIYKEYYKGNKKIPEENISFDIYNHKNELYTTITTNRLGYASAILPYGTYTINQVNTSEGYDYVAPFSIQIKDNETKSYKLENKIIEAKLEIHKFHMDNNQKIDEGNIKFGIYDEKNELYTAITTNELGTASAVLPYGLYTIKQLTAKEGYNYIEPIKIEIKDNQTKYYELENIIIKGILKLNKVYIDNEETLPESNIVFGIYDKNNQLYKTIITDKDGTANITLPYGTYEIKQLTTTDGYDYIEPFIINIKDSSTITYNLTNYKIKVPNTYIEHKNYNIFISLVKKVITYVNKIINYLTIHK